MYKQLQTGLICVIALVLLSACATVTSQLDPPKINIEDFRSLPTEGGAPRFEITLRVINPNAQALDIVGISYSIELLGRELITGVSKNIPSIGGYSEGLVTLDAGLQLFELLRLLASVGSQEDGPLEYRFLAKIDFAGFVPTQRIEESGKIAL
ncbi:LEA type 2 family protein [Candidatus Marimicrobium litorale]|uniref:LEA type 2 family protein n=1 Tax=Candidatus Marimicrobium litorale TaxID=2518991 RepID=UPI0024332B67|nr:LEA type 2 family protein [Candidatus Marimicrobium litorale]